MGLNNTNLKNRNTKIRNILNTNVIPPQVENTMKYVLMHT